MSKEDKDEKFKDPTPFPEPKPEPKAKKKVLIAQHTFVGNVAKGEILDEKRLGADPEERAHNRKRLLDMGAVLEQEVEG